jgi:outer membrane protein assembly factor BamB
MVVILFGAARASAENWPGPGAGQKLVAVDRRSGKTVWEQAEPGGTEGKAADNASWVGSWATPIVVKMRDHDELIQSMSGKLKAFDPNTGQDLWHWCIKK